MSAKIIYIIIAALILIGGGLYIYDVRQRSSDLSNNEFVLPAENPSGASQNSLQNTSNGNTGIYQPKPSDTQGGADAVAEPSTDNSQTAGHNSVTDETHFSDESDIDGNDVSVQVVSYEDGAFIPSRLSVKQGDVVIFKNSDQGGMWPASDPHPSHTNYPEFDAKAAIATGQIFEFKFTKIGTWGYHNHLKPAAKGTIIVTQ